LSRWVDAGGGFIGFIICCKELLPLLQHLGMVAWSLGRYKWLLQQAANCSSRGHGAPAWLCSSMAEGTSLAKFWQ
jgi:hypothetical protein